MRVRALRNLIVEVVWPLLGQRACDHNLVTVAASPVRRGEPVSAVAVGICAPTTPGKQSLLCFVGFARERAETGARFAIAHDGPAELFSGLPVLPVFVDGRGTPVSAAELRADTFYRGVGVGLTPSTLLIKREPVFLKGRIVMADTPLAADPDGVLVPDSSQEGNETGIAGAAFGPGPVALYRSDVGGSLFPLDGAKANVANFVGISDGGLYAIGSTVTFAPPGRRISGLTGLNVGELWVTAVGTLVPLKSSVPSGSYTKRVAVALTPTLLAVVDGETFLQP